jgi:hypothetical protein
MHRNNSSKNREKENFAKPLANPILFDHYINKNLYPHSEPKSKTVNQEGWKHYATLCLMFLVTPFLLFSEEPTSHTAADDGQSSTLTAEDTLCKP